MPIPNSFALTSFSASCFDFRWGVSSRCRQTNHYSAHDNFTGQMVNQSSCIIISSSSTRKLDTGHWPMLAVVWAMSPAPKMKESSAASHDLYSVRCAYQFREIHSHPQDQVTESVHLFTVERRVSIIYSHTVVYSQIFSVLIHRNCCGKVGSW